MKSNKLPVIALLQPTEAIRQLAEKHDFIQSAVFRFKSFGLTVKRQLENTFSGIQQFQDQDLLAGLPVIARSASNLWNADDRGENWLLTAGKIQNLRVTAKQLDGIEIPANATFSFWKQVGRPAAAKGYTIGREIREGCLVPNVAGGLCQLSNALYDAAMQSGFEILERHRHTKIIKGSLAEQDRDAAVKWSYVDLRFRSASAFRVEVELTAEKLIVTFKSSAEKTVAAEAKNTLPFSKINDCYSCGNVSCFQHPANNMAKKEQAITAFILDEKWAEYDAYISKTTTANDVFILPLFKNKFIKTNRYNWTAATPGNTKALTFSAIRRAIMLRYFSASQNVFSMKLRLDKKMAKAAAALIPVECTHVVVAQNLVPFLMETGALQGRTFDVLMYSLPLEKIHQQLDLGHALHPESITLTDFRASQQLIELENKALVKAQYIISPHVEIATLFKHNIIQPDWILPKTTEQRTTGTKVLFPAAALARKGAYEIRQLAKELHLNIVISGKTMEKTDFWQGINIQYAGNDPLENIGLVIYPAYVEHQPRFLLKALAAGIPVITTTSCGLTKYDNLTTVPAGDYEALKQAVIQQLTILHTPAS